MTTIKKIITCILTSIVVVGVTYATTLEWRNLTTVND
jgi:hypothetical protein